MYRGVASGCVEKPRIILFGRRKLKTACGGAGDENKKNRQCYGQNKSDKGQCSGEISRKVLVEREPFFEGGQRIDPSRPSSGDR